MSNLAPGDRALIVDNILIGPVVIEDIKLRFGGEPGAGVRIYWRQTAGRERTLQHTDGWSGLAACPPGYEPPPETEGVDNAEWFMLALEWLHRHRALLTQIHGQDAVSQTADILVRRIIGCRRRDEALARG